MNPYLALSEPKAWGPGSFEMAGPLIEALSLKPGMRILEIGGGSGQIASLTAKHSQVRVVVLEPWSDGSQIQMHAVEHGVANEVLPMKLMAQSLPFPDHSFDCAFSIGSFEMIGKERPPALQEIIRVLRPGGRFGIAEPLCLPEPMPGDLAEIDEEHKLGFRECFRSLDWNIELFQSQGLHMIANGYFPEARQWWLNYRDQRRISEAEQQLITLDTQGWITLGMVVGRKPLQ